ncbi:hypothetical protein TSMEX_008700 [Taenia solium]|eukprot:TsM_001036400 transcript=TsM_001036400 gene=TsM_001036400
MGCSFRFCSCSTYGEFLAGLLRGKGVTQLQRLGGVRSKRNHFRDTSKQATSRQGHSSVMNMEEYEIASLLLLNVGAKLSKTSDLRKAVLLTHLKRKAVAYVIRLLATDLRRWAFLRSRLLHLLPNIEQPPV